jgi:hypothetical protein
MPTPRSLKSLTASPLQWGGEQNGTKFELLSLTLILILGAVLRFGWPGVNSFAFDEARLSLISLRMARGGEFASLGMPSSVGVPNLPAAAWIYALPYFVSPDPLVATWFTGLLSLLAVVGVWWLARRWSVWAGLTAALYLAASPYAVLYSRSVWAQDLLAPLAVLWLWAGYVGANLAGSRRVSTLQNICIALNVFLAGFAFQVHFAGAALALGTLYLFIRFRWWRQFIPVLIGGGLALLALVPFARTVTCCAPQVIDEFRAAMSANAPQVDLKGFQEVIRLGLAQTWDYLAAGDLGKFESGVLDVAVAVVLVAGVIALVSQISLGTRRALSLQNEDKDSVGEGLRPSPTRASLPEMTLLLLLVAPLFFIRHSTPVFIHYQLTSLPALALIAGASTTLVKHKLWGRSVITIMAIIAAMWTVQIAQNLESAGRVETPNGLGTPLANSRDAAYGVPDDAPVLFFTHGDNPDLDGEVAVFSALWWGRNTRIIQGEAVLILPDEPAYLMATLRPFQAWEELETAGLALDVQEFPRREGALPFVMTHYDGTREPEGFTRIDPIVFEDGARLEGWKARRVGPRLRISTLWRVLETPPAGVYQQFHHLYASPDVNGEPLQGSDVPLSVYNWRAGDRVIVMGDFFDVPPGEYWVNIGHYTLPDVARVGREDGGDSVLLGPFAWE